METNAFIDYNTRLFRWVAPIYGVFDAVLEPLRGQFVDYLKLTPGTRLLDAATGTGRQALAFADSGFEVVGVDLSVDMLAKARRAARSPKLEFMVGNAAALRFRDGEFSAAIMSFALHCMPPNVRLAAVKELARVVQPGGVVAFLDYAKPERQPARSVLPWLVSIYETQLFKQYIHSDFDEMLRRGGLYRERERRLYGDMVRMSVCRHLPTASRLPAE
jgi:ubiquinone/menaquinone biosynthesis C-methylase UbiE